MEENTIVEETKVVEEKQPKSTKEKTIFGLKIAGNIVFYAIILALLLFSIMNINAGSSNGGFPNIFGHGFLSVQSNSMTRTGTLELPDEYKNYKIGEFDKGDLLYASVVTKDEDIRKLKVGDVITFYDSTIENLNSHRIVYSAYNADGSMNSITVQGDLTATMYGVFDPSDSTKSYQIEVAIDDMNIAQQMTADAEEIFTWASTRNLMNMSDSDPVAAGEQTFYLENGSLGSLITDKKVVNPQIGDQILSFAYTGLLKNPVIVKNVDESTGNIKYKQQYTDNVYDLDWIYFTLVYDPGYKPDVKQAALELVDTYRRDCVLISDCGDNADYEDCLKYVGAVKGAADCRIWNTYLAARYEPYSRVYDKFTAKDIWVSPVYHMAKLIPQMDSLYNLWNAAAGFTRGVCSDIKELRYSPNKAQRDLLYMAQVNPIVHFPEGMTVWGNLTTQKKTSTLSDLNCVRCVLYIKRALEQYCRNYIFEINDQATWDSIYGGISPFLDTVQANGGIQSYSLEVGATDYELKTKTCHVNVTLVPTKILEKIELNLYIK